MTGNVVLVIDEAHNHQHESIALVNWARREATATERLVSVEMTATGYDIYKKKHIISNGSNFPITDVLIDGKDVVDRVVRECEGSRRIVVFLPSVRGRTFSIQSTKKLVRDALNNAGKRAVLAEFLGETFTNPWPKINGTYSVPLVILATNIAEMGLNMNVDVVVDTCRQMVFVEESEKNNVIVNIVTDFYI